MTGCIVRIPCLLILHTGGVSIFLQLALADKTGKNRKDNSQEAFVFVKTFSFIYSTLEVCLKLVCCFAFSLISPNLVLHPTALL